MSDLVLKYNGADIRRVRSGGWVELPDGRRMSPAHAGWQSSDGYALVAYVAPILSTSRA